MGKIGDLTGWLATCSGRAGRASSNENAEYTPPQLAGHTPSLPSLYTRQSAQGAHRNVRSQYKPEGQAEVEQLRLVMTNGLVPAGGVC